MVGELGFSNPKLCVTVTEVSTIPPGLLEEAIERLKTEFQPEQIFLFGSHAWGAPRDDSDVDLMVIVRNSTERPIRRMQRAHRCLRGLRMSKDVFVQTREEFDRYKDVGASLQRLILERGKRVYG